jgi:hypothetical protein
VLSSLAYASRAVGIVENEMIQLVQQGAAMNGMETAPRQLDQLSLESRDVDIVPDAMSAHEVCELMRRVAADYFEWLGPMRRS